MLPAQLSALSAQQVLLKSREMGNLSQNQQHQLIKKIMMNLMNESNPSFPQGIVILTFIALGANFGWSIFKTVHKTS